MAENDHRNLQVSGMRKRVNIITVTQAERQSVVGAIGQAVGDVGGWVDDVNFFSNISIALRSYIPSRKLVELGYKLVEIGLKIEPKDFANLEDAAATNSPGFEVLCSMQITFFHNEPDLRREIPSVPG